MELAYIGRFDIMNILFVCTGNTCRSPIAEKILKKRIMEENLDIEVKSAGLAAIVGDTYSEHAQTIIKEYTDETHQSQKVTDELLDWADFILTMTNNHKQVLIDQNPTQVEKIFTLKEFSLINEDIKEGQKRLEQLYAEVKKKKEEFFLKNQLIIEQLEEKYNFLLKETDRILVEINQYKNDFKELIKDDLNEIEEITEKISTLDIADPYGRDLVTYKLVAREIEESIDNFLKKYDSIKRFDEK